MPDHAGPRSAFMAGYEEGYATLDGIRAGLSYLDLPSTTPIGMVGYSGGGHATAWASHLADSYASDLTIVAAAYGGTPVDLLSMLEFLNKKPFSGFVAMGIAGILSAYPETEAHIRSILHPEVVETLDLVRSEDFCVLNAVSQHHQFDWTPLLRIGSDSLLD